MGLRHSRKKIEIVNVLKKKYKEKPHLDVKGEIILRKYYTLDIPEIDIRFEGYFPACVRLWPYDRPSPSLTVSSTDSGIDKVNQFEVMIKILCCKHFLTNLEETNI